MLLNNESRYYTIFTYRSKHDYHKMADKIISIAKELGDIKSIERNGKATEFWIMDEGECKLFMLFDYSQGVITIE